MGVMRLLLERNDVNPDGASKSSLTLCFEASMNDHEEIFKLPLGRKYINHNHPCESGRIPLQLTAANGHERVVNLFLRRKEAQPQWLKQVWPNTVRASGRKCARWSPQAATGPPFPTY